MSCIHGSELRQHSAVLGLYMEVHAVVGSLVGAEQSGPHSGGGGEAAEQWGDAIPAPQDMEEGRGDWEEEK